MGRYSSVTNLKIGRPGTYPMRHRRQPEGPHNCRRGQHKVPMLILTDNLRQRYL